MISKGLNKYILIILISLINLACSGGGDGDVVGTGETPKTLLSGTAAVGKPLANKEVIVRGKEGGRKSVLTDDKGVFKIDVADLKPPFLLKVDDDQGKRLYSLASGFGVNNIHPLSDVAARNWFKSRSLNIDARFDDSVSIDYPAQLADQIAAIIEALKKLLVAAFQEFSVDSEFDFQHNGFAADHNGFDNLLDHILINIKQDKITIKLIDKDGNFQVTIILDFDLSTDISDPDTTPPVLADSLLAFTVNATDVILVWNPATDNVGVAGYRVHRSGGAGPVQFTTAFPVYADKGLESGVEYCYTVEAFDGAFDETKDPEVGLSNPTSEACVTPQEVVGNTPPEAATGLTVAATSDSEISLSWTPSASDDVIGYDIFRGPAGAVVDKIATVVSSNYGDFNLAAETQYCYIVKAFDAQGARSVSSSEVCDTTNSTIITEPTPDITPPMSSADLSAGTYASAQTVHLSCSDTGGSGCDAIYYTTSGADPTIASAVYSSGIVINSTTTLKYFAVDVAGNMELPIHTSTYTIDISVPVGPVANPGTSQTVATTSLVTLDGSGSYSASSISLAYQWTLVGSPAGSKAYLLEDTSVYPRLVTDLPGSYEIALVVNDGTSDSVSISVFITVDAAVTNQAPTANAGVNQQFNSLPTAPVLLDGSGSSDPESSALTYSWAFINKPASSNAILQNPTSAMPSFTPDVTGFYSIGLVVNDGSINSSIDTVEVSIASTSNETEGNNTLETAQIIPVATAVSAAIDVVGDVDWYGFPVVEGETYVVEVFDASNNLVLTAGNCGYSAYYGLSLSVIDFNAATVVSQCNPIGHGNVHTYVKFTASATGMYYAKVSTLNAAGDVGSYKIRVMPKHDQPGATWNVDDFEPNNVAALAYGMKVGLNNAITSDIESRSSLYSTFNADVDWYRFEATAGETYVVELFDVTNSLAVTAGNCGYTAYVGLSLAVANAQETVVASQCIPNGHNNIHNYVQFTASVDGVHYIKVSSINIVGNDVGSYKLRVLPKHGQLGADWDATSFEPNDVPALAYGMEVGLNNAITSDIQSRSAQYKTISSDLDWYRFEATAGETYVVELFDVANSLAVSAANCAYTAYVGLSLTVANEQETVVASQCIPNGHNNIHNYVQFTASADGVHYIKVSPINATSSDIGSYKLRILPKHDQAGATWDTTSFEPNDVPALAYAMEIGLNNSITSDIQSRSAQYKTINADVDWYRFEATAGETYVVELFDVANSLAVTAANCAYTAYTGLSLAVANSTETVVASQCNPNGNGNVHSYVEFVASSTGVHYIKVSTLSAVSSDIGTYSLRILPRHDQIGAEWNASDYEPNNLASLAYPIELTTLTVDNSLHTNIEARKAQFKTVQADTDFFRFNAESGVTYIIEVYDVDVGLLVTPANCAYTSYKGLSLDVRDSSNTVVASQCNPVTVGNIHTSLSFTASTTGVHYINVRPINVGGSDSGIYSIRIQ